jgi:hypothetical protein
MALEFDMRKQPITNTLRKQPITTTLRKQPITTTLRKQNTRSFDVKAGNISL